MAGEVRAGLFLTHQRLPEHDPVAVLDDQLGVDLPWTRLDAVTTATRPAARPRPPIWMAANSDAAVRRAARLADTWMINPHATAETVRRQLGVFADERVAAGRPEKPDELGVDHFVFRTEWAGMPVEHARASVELLAREVVPVLRAA